MESRNDQQTFAAGGAVGTGRVCSHAHVVSGPSSREAGMRRKQHYPSETRTHARVTPGSRVLVLPAECSLVQCFRVAAKVLWTILKLGQTVLDRDDLLRVKKVDRGTKRLVGEARRHHRHAHVRLIIVDDPAALGARVTPRVGWLADVRRVLRKQGAVDLHVVGGVQFRRLQASHSVRLKGHHHGRTGE